MNEGFCIFFAMFEANAPTVLRESDVFALLHKRRQELIQSRRPGTPLGLHQPRVYGSYTWCH
jgi:hypothetical protein